MLHTRPVVVATVLLVAIAFGLPAASASAASSELLPTPAKLEPNVRFWTRVYTEVDTGGGLIHDSRNLDVVYEVVRLPQGVSRRTRERRVETVRKRYKKILSLLGQGRRSDLTGEQARVLALWPEGTTDKTFRAAASRVRFQLGQANKFRDGLIRSGQWRDYIYRAMAEHGVPTELAALPHVESSYNPSAYSRVGAAGLWQFTRSTGRLYLRVDHVVDERMDPWKATVGAARLLRDNRRRLEEWPLAITAYNHGVGGMARAVRKLGTRDMGEISERYRGRTFGFASRNFYSEFLAASAIHQDPARYFGPLSYDTPRAYVMVETDHYYAAPSLERALGVDLATLRENNLALRPSVWNGAKFVPKGYPVRVPAEAVSQAPTTLLAAIPESERIAQQKRDRWHKVRRGESLSKIARRYHTSQRELVALNNLRSRHRIRAGQVLRLPDDGSAPLVVSRSAPPSDGIYRVRRGDSLSIVAARFGVGVNDLVRWNRLRNKHRLAIGQPLQVSAPGAEPAAAPTTVVARADAAPAPAAPRTATPPPAPAKSEPEPVTTARNEPEPAKTARSEPAPTPPAPSEAAPAPSEPAPAPVEPAEAGTTPPVLGPVVAAIPDDETLGEELPSASTIVVARESGGVAVPDPSNYTVSRGSVIVQAEETLGHYAEWLEVSTSRLRRLNNMRYGTPLVIGRRKKLDFSRVTPEVFEQRRLAFHRDLQEEFFSAFVVNGTQTHTLRRGDSLWYLANEKYEVPIWLLRHYNPEIDFGALPAGTPMVIPNLEPRNASEGAHTPSAPMAASLATRL
jgi:membrane-bound lytic murein transglycosylase D